MHIRRCRCVELAGYADASGMQHELLQHGVNNRVQHARLSGFADWCAQNPAG